ncbi:MAG: hypothetical protein OXP66_09900 [Candidatus Tectomicrobia bacterium]|nr:hypothetical protein [Candidatus Tectomicrobia bacterium]
MFQSQAPRGYRAVSTVLCMLALTLTLSGCGGGRSGTASPVVSEPITTIDWLVPADAREVFEAAYSHFKDAAPTNPERSYAVDDISFFLPRLDSPGAKEWDYWNQPYLSADIIKIQARPVPGTYEAPLNEARAVYGILDHGIFWIADDAQFEERPFIGAGYDHLDHNQYMLLPDGPPADFLTSGTSWRGDALGMVKASASPVSGPAVLTMTSIQEAPDGGHAYNLHLHVAFRNLGVDRVELNATSNAAGGFAADLAADGGYRLKGTFLGSQAEEATGIFETPVYYGAFGVKR